MMTVTEKLRALNEKVAKIEEIHVMEFDSRKALDNFLSVQRSICGVKESVIDGNAEYNGQLFFGLQCKMYYLKEEGTSWREGICWSLNIISVSDNLDKSILLLESFLQANPQYFVTYTDKYGHIYGKKEK